ncbi:ALPK1 [Branchiostoma lanceolatum]|uniref:ALPK1 protein n=1 Tax=Branchiostoma lanceolatum TaxID=7740 RepID=A0A8J9Z3T5_BRALA|nr:ALPK1 [Branchiostoma lanceolatum]
MEQETCNADSIQRLSSNLGLLSVELQGLLRDAEAQRWSFIPETWQFEDRVGEQDMYNVKDLITAPSTHRPGKTEADVLWECADLAVECKNYPRAVAILFLLDRYAFWQGTSPRLLKVIDDIRQASPSTPVPPQIIIRKARVLTNAGDLHGAERVLDDVLNPDTETGTWTYRSDSDRAIVHSVCIQIKGQVQLKLGQWYDASTLILDSIIGFRTLPKPDKKGIASSVGLLMDVFKNISYRDFQILKQQYTLQADSPLLEAYRSAEEAAHLSKYDPLFYARHRRRAGEVLIQCAQQARDSQEKQKFLQLARTNLSESLQSHESVEALRSREQLCEFICALFQSCQVLEMTGAAEKSNNLTKMCMHLYEEYCAVESSLSTSRSIKRMIHFIMEELDTLMPTSQPQETLGGDATASATETTLSYSLSIDHVVPENSTTQTHPRENNPSQAEGATTTRNVTAEGDGKKRGTVDSGFDTTEDEDSDNTRSTVDPSAATVDDANSIEENFPNDNLQSSSTIDPSATTVDQTRTKLLQTPTDVDQLCQGIEKHHIQPSTVDPAKTTLGSTIDPSATTVDVANEKVGLDEEVGHVGKGENGSSHVGDSRHEESISDEEQKKWDDMFADLSPVTRVHKAFLHKYDPFNDKWESEHTLVYLGDPLPLDEGKKGKQRDAFFVQYISQEEAMGRYVGKRYKKDKPYEQYRQDVCCQMTARKYVTVFNHKLRRQQDFGQIQYLPAVTLQVNHSQPDVSFTVNVEPYIDGDFVKLTNNLKYKHPVLDSGLATAFTHFTYEASGEKLMIVDIQGWTTVDGRGVTYFTDPQIHSEEIKKYGRGNLGDRGVQAFWREQHPRCNKVCRLLKLRRPVEAP